MERGFLYIFDFETAGELNQYVETSRGIYKCEDEKGHDDLVAALYWAMFFLNTNYYLSATNTENVLVRQANIPTMYKSGVTEDGKLEDF